MYIINHLQKYNKMKSLLYQHKIKENFFLNFQLYRQRGRFIAIINAKAYHQSNPALSKLPRLTIKQHPDSCNEFNFWNWTDWTSLSAKDRALLHPLTLSLVKLKSSCVPVWTNKQANISNVITSEAWAGDFSSSVIGFKHGALFLAAWF